MEAIKHTFRLFITGQSPRSQRAVTNLRRLCETQLAGDFEIEVVDVLERPDAAEDDKVIATPTLILLLPPPSRRLVGDLSDMAQVRLELGLDM